MSEGFLLRRKDFPLTQEEFARFQERLVDQALDFVQGIGAEGERAAVLLGAARIDVALEKLLIKLMHAYPTRSDPLFSSERPLSSLSAKIYLAYRLGAIDENFERALHKIRKVRNDFAHSTAVLSLSNPPYSDHISELVKLTEQGGSFHGTAAQIRRNEKFSAKLVDFCVSVMAILIALEVVTELNEQLKPDFSATLNDNQFYRGKQSP